MPINTKYPLAQVIEAAKEFDRRVTFEYVMLAGINDLPEHALQLAWLAQECKAFVNLIPLHPGGAGDFTPTSARDIRAFADELRDQNIEVAVRTSRGQDIAAACGQLRVEREHGKAPNCFQPVRWRPHRVMCPGRDWTSPRIAFARRNAPTLDDWTGPGLVYAVAAHV